MLIPCWVNLHEVIHLQRVRIEVIQMPDLRYTMHSTTGTSCTFDRMKQYFPVSTMTNPWISMLHQPILPGTWGIPKGAASAATSAFAGSEPQGNLMWLLTIHSCSCNLAEDFGWPVRKMWICLSALCTKYPCYSDLCVCLHRSFYEDMYIYI